MPISPSWDGLHWIMPIISVAPSWQNTGFHVQIKTCHSENPIFENASLTEKPDHDQSREQVIHLSNH